MEQVKILCVNTGKSYEFDMGSKLYDISKVIFKNGEMRPVAVLVDNSLKDLHYRLFEDKRVEFVDVAHSDGRSVVVRSLILLLYTAFRELYPKGSLCTEFYISGGLYCTLEAKGYDGSKKAIEEIKERMRSLVKSNLPIHRERMKTEDAIELFRKDGLSDKAYLLDTRGRLQTSVYRLNSVADYFFGVLAPETGLLDVFDLLPYGDGVILLFPSKKDVTILPEVSNFPKLMKVSHDNRQWGKALNVSSIGDLNRFVADENTGSIIKICEAFQEKQISQIADMIAERRDKVKLVLIAGPSSSGKTTFSKRLSVQLSVDGFVPVTLSMDDYFVERVNTPRDENGNYDYECVEAVDIPLFIDNVTRLMAGEEVEMPKYSFITGTRSYDGTKMKLEKNSVIVVEGIHGLNPKLTSLLKREAIFKIFISALTAISIDEHNPINPTDNRLIRRIVRDHKYRGRSARVTLEGWQSVLDGEQKNIVPYQEEADVMFNTAMMYELGVLRGQAMALLLEVPESCAEFSKAQKLLKFLSYVKLIFPDEIPPVSLLREFLGGSSFTYE